MIKHLLLPAAALLAGCIAAPVLAQDQAGGGNRSDRQNRGNDQGGGQGRGNFDPAQFRQRFEDNVKEQLGASDDEWKVIQPKLEKLMLARRDAGGFGMFTGRGGRGDRGGDSNETLSPAQQAGCEWIRKTPPRTVVQADPLARDRQNWSIIPTFAGRRMAVGQALPLLPEPQQQGGKERAHAILVTLPPLPAHDEARRLGINYLWFDEDDVSAKIGANPPRFKDHPELFTLVFQQNDVFIYHVN